MSIQDFEPIRVLGQGGMGRVWEARHLASGQAVAVKVLAPASDHSFLNDELGALARLDHHNVMQIFDWGYVEKTAPGWDVTERQPYIVLELVEGSPLDHYRMGWQEIRLTLLGILDALAHAHARGVIHRDLKPANVSVRAQDRGLDVRLLDFGIAQLHNVGADETAEAVNLTGTPKYMAPEQIQGNRKVGPWSDLYSVGCIAFKLTTGSPPFTKGDRFDILRSHVVDPVPEHNPNVPVPAGFEDWVNRLLQKHPADRYPLAADAAYDLMNLGPPVGHERSGLSVDENSATEIFGATVFDSQTWGAAVTVPALTTAFAIQPPPVPRSWAELASGRGQANWATAALSLFHLRRFRMTGRKREQDILWDTLTQVAQGEPRLVLVTGPSGIGKTRLTTWLGERAEELGSARHLVLRSGEGPRGVGLMLRRFFGLQKRARNALDEIRTWFSRRVDLSPGVLVDCVALVDLMFPETTPETRPQSPQTQFSAIGRFLAAFERAVVFSIDDADTDPYALKLAAHVAGLDAAILTLVNGRKLGLDDAVSQVLELAPLAPTAQRMLIAAAAQLDPENTARLVDRAGGNPLYVLRILGDWVDSGALKLQGDRLTLGVATPPLPKDLAQAVLGQLERELTSDNDWSVAELAAVLGGNFVEAELEACAQESGLKVGDVLDRLSRVDTIERQFGIVHFRNGVSREALLERANSSGRLKSHHSVCATTLGHNATYSAIHYHRIGAHFAAAEQWLQCAEAHLRAAEINDFYLAIKAQAEELDAYDNAVTRWGGTPSTSLQSTRIRLETRQVANEGDLEQAKVLAAKCLALATASGDVETRAHAHFMASQLGLGDDLAHSAESIAFFKQTSNVVYVIVVSQFHASDLAATGQFNEAIRMFREAFSRAKSLGEHPIAISVAASFCALLLDREELEACEKLIAEADSMLEFSPDSLNRAGSALIHAKLSFLRHDYAQARTETNIALRMASETDNGYMDLVSRAWLAGIEIADGRIQACREALEPVVKWRETRLVSLLIPVDITLAATVGDRVAIFEGLETLNALLDDRPRTRALGPWLLEIAAQRTSGDERLRILTTLKRWWGVMLLNDRVRAIDALLAKYQRV